MAVRPTAALLNHSCWPNTVRCSLGGAVVLMAAVDIKPGDEVNNKLEYWWWAGDRHLHREFP